MSGSSDSRKRQGLELGGTYLGERPNGEGRESKSVNGCKGEGRGLRNLGKANRRLTECGAGGLLMAIRGGDVRE